MQGSSSITKVPANLNVLAVITLALAFVLFYQTTILKLVTTWSESTTYEHGFLIVPIVLWLIYQLRDEIQAMQTQSSYLGVGLLCIASLAWFVTTLTHVNILEQLVLLCLPILIVLGLFGKAVAWRIRFPLAYLFLAIPVGDFLIPYLQFITADISVFMVKLVGIPVYRDGMYIQIPNGNFHVAEACSGIRFLISTITLSILFSYLNFQRLRKKISFVIIAIFVSIIGNGLRAFLMIFIGHVSDMQAAVGFDHLVYGWVFFSFILLVLFFIGNKLADKPLETIDNSEQKEESQPVISCPSFKVSIAAILAISTGPIANYYYSNVQAKHISNAAYTPSETSITSSNYSWNPTFPKADIQQFSNIKINQISALEYFAEYNFETADKELISWDNQLFDPDKWSIKSINSPFNVNLGDDNGEIALNWITIVNLQGKSKDIYYTYQVGSSFQNSKLKTKILQLVNKVALQDLGGKVHVLALNAMFAEETKRQTVEVWVNKLDKIRSSSKSQMDSQVKSQVSKGK